MERMALAANGNVDGDTKGGAAVGRRRPSLRPVIDRIAAAVTSPLDRAFDQVLERNLDVRSVDHAEELLSVLGAREKASANVGAWIALAASLRPVLMRIAKGAQRTTRAARWTGAGRMAAWSVTATIAASRMVDSSRSGVNELQIMAAYLASRVREQGQRPSRDAVEQAALALYTKPGRRIVVGQPRRKLLSAAARRWVLDAFRPDAEDSRRRRTRARLRAVAELPDDELRLLYDTIEVIDVGVARSGRRGLRALGRG
jgi:hypothetical protein